ncbi:phosphatase PAP2 family protein [Amycolatopsis sp. 195334CR]|uniref:phosphatase PAP2 family protein n=1 Tax=Amycolatopsis sp. 195334CR TaxID=2814588 RepID=UPI0027DC8F4A|nr:phosphatase PAP2 family protein [Amycolatopsis sp. 195334CR]
MPIARVRPALSEIALLALVFAGFIWLHGTAKSDAATATANALALQSLERALHLDIVPGLNRWLVEHPALIQPAVLYYRLYYVVLLGVLVWLFRRHTEVYRTARRTLIAMAVLVLPVFWALPMSPPRFATPGVVDIIAEHDLFGDHSARALESGQNVYSAMPSMHTAWALWCAYAAWLALRTTRPRLAWLPWLFPLGMIAVVFTTGNHYVLDIVGSVVLLLASIAVVAALPKLLPKLSRS